MDLKDSSGFSDIIPVYSAPDFSKSIKADTSDFVYHGKECVRAEDIVAFHDGDVLLFLGLDMPSVFHRKESLEKLVNRGVRVYVFLYDLIPYHYPEFFGFGRMYLNYLEAITHFSGFIAISKFTMDDFKAWREKHSISVRKNFLESYVHLGSDFDEKFGISASHESDKKFEEFGSRKTFIVVSTLEPRKMHGQILDAFDLLWKGGQDVNLVFVGKAGWLVDDLLKKIEVHPEKGKRFFWFDNMGDDALNALYERADALIFASLIEGFGLGIVEAAAKHCKLILRDIPVFREVAGDGALYFSGEKPGDLAEKVTEWISLDDAGSAPASEGVEVLSWRQCAEKLLDIIREHGKE